MTEMPLQHTETVTVKAREEDSNVFVMSLSPNSRRGIGNSCLGPLCGGLGPGPGGSPLAGSA